MIKLMAIISIVLLPLLTTYFMKPTFAVFNCSSTAPCINAGTCDGSTGLCTCAATYTGLTCDTHTMCTPNCKHGGQCLAAGEPYCSCPYSWGKDCSYPSPITYAGNPNFPLDAIWTSEDITKQFIPDADQLPPSYAAPPMDLDTCCPCGSLIQDDRCYFAVNLPSELGLMESMGSGYQAYETCAKRGGVLASFEIGNSTTKMANFFYWLIMDAYLPQLQEEKFESPNYCMFVGIHLSPIDSKWYWNSYPPVEVDSTLWTTVTRLSHPSGYSVAKNYLACAIPHMTAPMLTTMDAATAMGPAICMITDPCKMACKSTQANTNSQEGVRLYDRCYTNAGDAQGDRLATSQACTAQGGYLSDIRYSFEAWLLFNSLLWSDPARPFKFGLWVGYNHLKTDLKWNSTGVISGYHYDWRLEDQYPYASSSYCFGFSSLGWSRAGNNVCLTNNTITCEGGLVDPATTTPPTTYTSCTLSNYTCCPCGWIRYLAPSGAETCYLFVNTAKTWTNAMAACDGITSAAPYYAYLASPDNADQLNFLLNHVNFTSAAYWISYSRDSYGGWNWPNGYGQQPPSSFLGSFPSASNAGACFGSVLRKSDGKILPVCENGTATLPNWLSTYFFSVPSESATYPYICEMEMAPTYCQVCKPPTTALPLPRHALRVSADKCVWFVNATGTKAENDATCYAAGLMPLTLQHAYETALSEKMGNSAVGGILWLDLVMPSSQTSHKWEGPGSNYSRIDCANPRNNQYHYPCAFVNTTDHVVCENCATPRYATCTIPSAVTCSDLCPYGFEAITSSCFKADLTTTVSSPFTARESCYQKYGTYNLASITSWAVKTGLENFIVSLNVAVNTKFWIGFDNSIQQSHGSNSFANFTYAGDPDNVWESDNSAAIDNNLWVAPEPQSANHYALATWDGAQLVLSTVSNVAPPNAYGLCERPKPCYRCDAGWIFFNGHCYYKEPVGPTATIRQMRGYCDLLGQTAYLMSINYALELKFYQFLTQGASTDLISPLGLYRKKAFDSIPTMDTISDFYEWDDGQELDPNHMFWALSEPTGTNAELAHVFMTSGMADVSYAMKNYSFVVCEAAAYITTLRCPNKLAGTPSLCAIQLLNETYLNASSLTASPSSASYPVNNLLTGGFWSPTSGTDAWVIFDFGNNAYYIRSLTVKTIGGSAVSLYDISYTKKANTSSFYHVMAHRMLAIFGKQIPLTFGGGLSPPETQNICPPFLAYKVKFNVVYYYSGTVPLSIRLFGCPSATQVSTFCDCWVEIVDGYQGTTYSFWNNTASSYSQTDLTRSASAAYPLVPDDNATVGIDTWPPGWRSQFLDLWNYAAWWRVDFASLKIVSGIIMTGGYVPTDYVVVYAVKWSYSGLPGTFIRYVPPNNNSDNKYYGGSGSKKNGRNSTVSVQQTFCPPMKLKSLMLNCGTGGTKPSMVLSVYGCMARGRKCFDCCNDVGNCSCHCPIGWTGATCGTPTGTQVTSTPVTPMCESDELLQHLDEWEGSMTASSNTGNAANANGNLNGYWSPLANDSAPYLQINLGREMTISVIMLAGANGQWVSDYTVSFMARLGNSQLFYPILVNMSNPQSAAKVFTGARDGVNFVEAKPCPQIRTSSLKIHIGNVGNASCIANVRVLLKGCPSHTHCSSCSSGACYCPVGYTGSDCSTWKMPPVDCEEIANRNPNAVSGVYTLSPPHMTPFSAYCDFDTMGGGWTVILNRVDGSQDFNLNWTDYKAGFGNLSGGNFWLGNENIYSLTSSVYNNYNILFYMVTEADEKKIMIYDRFSVKNETDQYELNLGAFVLGEAGDVMTYHAGAKFYTPDSDSPTNCSRQHTGGWWYKTCFYTKLTGVYGNHVYGKGVLWYSITQYTKTLKSAKMLVRRSIATASMPNKQPSYPQPVDCQDILYANPGAPSGTYSIYPVGQASNITVYCEMAALGGGWIVIQRRKASDTSIYFNKTFSAYESGFGTLSSLASFYLGNARISMITKPAVDSLPYQLAVAMEDSNGYKRTSFYGKFYLDNGTYALQIAEYKAGSIETGGDSLSPLNGRPFQTYDQPAGQSCATNRPGGWWYKVPGSAFNGQDCSDSNLNGIYGSTLWERGIYWSGWKGRYVSLKSVSMMIKPVVSRKPTDCSEVLANNPNSVSGIYWIFPFGMIPLQVYCDMTTTIGNYGSGWTVIQKRRNNNVDFYQNWTTYKAGFSALPLTATSDLWLGNENIYRLTKWTTYSLLVLVQHPNGSWFYSYYDEFRLHSESDWYSIQVMNFLANISTAGDSLNPTIHKYFVTYDKGSFATCHASSGARSGWWRSSCCCHQSDLNNVLNSTTPNQVTEWTSLSGSPISMMATQMAIKRKDITLVYPLHASAPKIAPFTAPNRIVNQVCDIRHPYVSGGNMAAEYSIVKGQWSWQPTVCKHDDLAVTDCSVIQAQASTLSALVKSGQVDNLYLNYSTGQFSSYCDMETFGGGWTLLQRRVNGNLSFERSLAEYEAGFGSPSGNFWVGNNVIRGLTSVTPYELLIEMRTNSSYTFALYDDIYVSTAANILQVSRYRNCSTAGDSLSFANGKLFIIDSCGGGGYWHIAACSNGSSNSSSLNANYGLQSSEYRNIYWASFDGGFTPLIWTEMKIRRPSALHGRFIVAKQFNCNLGSSMTLTSIASADDCQAACTCQSSGFVCLSFVYDRFSTCTLRSDVCGFGQGSTNAAVDTYFRMDDCNQFAPTCGPPPTMNNTVMEVINMTAGQIDVKYACSPGSINIAPLLSGAQSTLLTCTAGSDGHWFGLWLDCRVRCGGVPDLTDANATFVDATVNESDVITLFYQCNPDTVRLAGNCSLICAPPYAALQGEPLNCTATPCSMPAAVPNSVNNYTVPNVIPTFWVTKLNAAWNYTCNSGYVFSGSLQTSAVTVCGSDGQWAPSLTTCIITCDSIGGCSNGGTCIAFNTCMCASGWAGVNCTIYDCSVIGNCTNGGTCSAPNVCSCQSGFSGIGCGSFDCSAIGGCQNSGTCVGPNTCSCQTGWTGSSCSSPDCAPIGGCNGGICIQPSNCSCPTGWTGTDCRTSNCTAIGGCQHGGSCVAPNNCSCMPGWTGVNCSKPDCSAIGGCGIGTCVQPFVCSCPTGWYDATCSSANCSAIGNCQNGGTCVSPNSCLCVAGFYGTNCSIASCSGIGGCQNGGSCVAPNSCSCPSGWVGTTCNLPDCTNIGGCLNDGTCTSANVCTCSLGWLGTQCQSADCSSIGGCQHGGSCSTPNACTCTAGWFGTTCTIPDCSPIGGCLNGGYCSSPLNCTCSGNWLGSNCSIPNCSMIGGCQHGGTCLSPNACTCPSGWIGISCSYRDCTTFGGCQNGGTCTAPNVCTCPSGWVGNGCSSADCSSLGGCKNGGLCSQPGVCVCLTGWSGSDCSVSNCSAIGDCQNGGNCTAPDSCTCPEEWTDSNCSVPVPPVCSTSEACQNAGTCSVHHKCHCAQGWLGTHCDTPDCSSVGGCAHGGTCVQPSVCNCSSGWRGENCRNPDCSPIGGCNNGGTCISANLCECLPTWIGATCNIPECASTGRCLNGGTCLQSGNCSCTNEWIGPTCATPNCAALTGGCLNGGSCIAPDVCSCSSGWRGVNCNITDCSSIGGCQNGGTCSGPNICTCVQGWDKFDCSAANCSQMGGCQHGGTCSLPNICSCPLEWTGASCTMAVEVIEIRQVDPTVIQSTANVSNATLVANIPILCNIVTSTAETILANTNISEIPSAALAFVTTVNELMDRFEIIQPFLTLTEIQNITASFSAAADAVMEVMTMGIVMEQTVVDAEKSKICQLAKDGSVGVRNDVDGVVTESTPIYVRPTPEQLQQLYGNFTELLESLVNIFKKALKAGQNFTYSGKFFSGIIDNRPYSQISGLKLETSLAIVEFPDAQEGSLFLKPELNKDTTLSTVMIGYIANVLDANLPFNMPTISVHVYVNRTKQLSLNPENQLRITGIPIVPKARLFGTQKVDAQCDISKIKCDLATNADKMASLVTFPVLPNVGDFMLIFPSNDLPYSVYISFDNPPDTSNYTWRVTVGHSGANLQPNSSLVKPKLNFVNFATEFRMLLPNSWFGSLPDNGGKLYVVMKRDFSKFAPTDDLPASACNLQHCYGYHLRIGKASASGKTFLSRRKRDDESLFEEENKIEANSTESAVTFSSNYFGDFGADLVILPNSIEFTTVFANFADLLQDNYAILAFVVSIVDLFLVAVVFTFIFDRKDLREWAFLPILSNRPDHSHKYLLSIGYYNVKQYKLKPKIYIRLLGNTHDTDWRLLEDGRRKNFEGKRPASFSMTTFIPVGKLDAIEVAVSSQQRPRKSEQPFQFHLDKVIVVDVATAEKYLFLVNRTMHSGDSAFAELAREEDIKGFRYLVTSHSRVGITDLHPWLSVAQRPLPSNWTRTERLACVVSALFMAMMVNAMFYGQENAAARVGIKIGNLFRISWFTVWTSLFGNVIIIPPTAVMGFIFKRVKRRSAERSEWETVFNLKIAAQEEDKQTKKKPLQLPWACVFIGWTLVALCVAVPAFIVFSYSLQWGREKSLQWLSGMLLHIVQDIIVIQTIKVFLTAVFSSSMLSLPDDGINIGKSVYSAESDKPKTVMFKRFRNVLVGIFHHMLYVIAFAAVIGTTLSPHAFRQVRDLQSLVTPKTGVITDQIQVFDWLSETLLPNFQQGNQLGYGGVFTRKNMYLVTNHEVVLLGPFRLRQQRVRNDSCVISGGIAHSLVGKYVPVLISNATSCQNQYSDMLGFADSVERRSFNFSWNVGSVFDLSTSNGNNSDDQMPWIYRDTDGPPYSGWKANYRTGGYYVDLSTQLSKARAFLSELKQRRWLDNATSVLFLDFVLYNPQINLFVAVKVVFEDLHAGGMSYHSRIYPMNLYQYSGENSFMTFAVQGVWMLFLLSHLGKVIWQMKKVGFKTFGSNGWNLLNLVQVMLSLCIVGVFAARIYVIIPTVTRFQTDRSTFVNLDLLANWEELMFNLYGIAFFMTMFLFFRHLTSNKYWAIFLGTLSRGKGSITSFVFLFVIFTFLFASVGYLSFGTTCAQFGSFTGSIMTLIQNVIGVTESLTSLTFTSRYILVFFLAYSSLVTFLAVQVFVTIISVTYQDVTNDLERNSDWDSELADYISDEWKKMLKVDGMKSKADDVRLMAGKSISFQVNEMLDRLVSLVDQFDKGIACDERRLEAWQEVACRLPRLSDPSIKQLLRKQSAAEHSANLSDRASESQVEEWKSAFGLNKPPESKSSSFPPKGGDLFGKGYSWTAEARGPHSTSKRHTAEQTISSLHPISPQ